MNIFCITNAQIYPSINDEYCPDIEYTFSVPINKPYQIIYAVNGPYITQLPIPPVSNTVTFKAKFADLNQKQTFEIHYTDGSQSNFDFYKVKSLFYANPCSAVPYVPNIIAPRCEISNFNISFTKGEYGTAFTSPILCFGSISDYEYLIPANWKIGTTVSNGTTWIQGSNNVIISSDLSTGDGMFVTIRAC